MVARPMSMSSILLLGQSMKGAWVEVTSSLWIIQHRGINGLM
jgi:hypothetical protein